MSGGLTRTTGSVTPVVPAETWVHGKRCLHGPERACGLHLLHHPTHVVLGPLPVLVVLDRHSDSFPIALTATLLLAALDLPCMPFSRLLVENVGTETAQPASL